MANTETSNNHIKTVMENGKFKCYELPLKVVDKMVQEYITKINKSGGNVFGELHPLYYKKGNKKLTVELDRAGVCFTGYKYDSRLEVNFTVLNTPVGQIIKNIGIEDFEVVPRILYIGDLNKADDANNPDKFKLITFDLCHKTELKRLQITKGLKLSIDKILNKDGDITPDDINNLSDEEQRKLLEDSGIQQSTEELMDEHLTDVPEDWGVING